MSTSLATDAGHVVVCAWCRSSDVPSLGKCARCRRVYYCSKDHQKRHWKTHKPNCLDINSTQNDQESVTTQSSDKCASTGSHLESSSLSKPPSGGVTLSCDEDLQVRCSDSNGTSQVTRNSTSKSNWPSQEWASNTTSQCLGLSSPVSSCLDPDPEASSSEKLKPTGSGATPAVRSIPWLQRICQNVVSDMNKYGICVLDNFLGVERGNAILKEVTEMYEHGIFTEGQLVNTKVKGPSQAIRGDRITWVHGTEPMCKNVGFLIQTLDSVITTCTKMKNSGQLGKVKIERHTKAMIACYPGNGTHYVKHVDNPHGDGRRVTSIYYLNKNWEKKHAGRLRIFPANHENQVAEIEPLFDRIVFFWSDRRNPHEVEPSYAVRFAITVWYFDDNERNNALKRYQQEVKKPEL